MHDKEIVNHVGSPSNDINNNVETKDDKDNLDDVNEEKYIMKNKMIKEIRLLHRRHWSSWITVWPFAILYLITVTLYIEPELVWGRVTYLVHQTYIDFFHAICTPLVLFLHVFLSMFTIWSVKFRAQIIFKSVPIDRLEDATDVLVITHPHHGESEIVPLVQNTDDGHPPCFIFQQRKWKLDDEAGYFVKPQFPVREMFSYYVHWNGLQSEADKLRQIDTYGLNHMDVTIPEFQDLFVDHALAPFFVFQMFCVLLWCLDEYWYYSLFMGVMMVAMECVTVWQRIQNMKILRNMAEVPEQSMTVIRRNKPMVISSRELLPLDLLVVPNNSPCPVDALLVGGTAVINESMLTGESTPQLKEAPDDAKIALSSKKHGRHMIFAGTHILLSSSPQHVNASGALTSTTCNNTTISTNSNKKEKNAKEQETSASSPEVSNTLLTSKEPLSVESHALAVVLKTGFETKQGKLLRTILHSQGRVSENSGEAFGFIGVLVVFALAASGYLLKRGLADPERSRWKLFLNCVQIITSVVPPELPMQLSLAVNTSLMALTKLQVFCTEPFRIPFAGKVDMCCFDKTGTLTTDEMLFAGVDMLTSDNVIHNKLKEIPPMSEMVLATCHSLVYLDAETLAGDEMEKASIKALGYRMCSNDVITYDPSLAARAYANTVHSPTEEQSSSNISNNNNNKNQNNKKKTGNIGSSSNSSNNNESSIPTSDPKKTYKIILRFPFLAALRRMSCVVQTHNNNKFYAVVKGSPEAVGNLCSSVPQDYIQKSERQAGKGFRVIALAIRELNMEEVNDITSLKRENIERDLHFVGLAIYVSPLKKDARETIVNLEGGSHRCVIITGDSVQTAISVGKDVALLQSATQLIASRCEDDTDDSEEEKKEKTTATPENTKRTSPLLEQEYTKKPKTITWRYALSNEILEADANDIKQRALGKLRRQYGVVPFLWSLVTERSNGKSNKNAKRPKMIDFSRTVQGVPGQVDLCVNAECMSAAEFTNVVQEYGEVVRIWARCAPSQKEEIVSFLKHCGHVVLMAGDGTNDVGALKQAEVGIAVLNSAAVTPNTSDNNNKNSAALVGPQPHNEFDVPAEYKIPPGFKFTVVPPQPQPGSPFREMLNWKMSEAKRKAEIMQIKKWNQQLLKMQKEKNAAKAAAPPPPTNVMTGSDLLMESLFNADEDMMASGAPMIKLGDASIAAPFTCRSKALTSVCDIVRLGRSTLVTTLMMYKILALNCLTSAYSMSVLQTDGVRLGEKQMILSGVILSVCFMCMARSKPTSQLCPQRPVTRVFHPYMISTVFLQFALHLHSMMQTVAMVSEVDLATVLDMKKNVENEKFKPTLLNSTMFLTTTLMSGITFAVNYPGKPFMERLYKNRVMFIALIILIVVIFTFALESDPELNTMFEIVAFPSKEFRERFTSLLIRDVVGSFMIDFICQRLFTNG